MNSKTIGREPSNDLALEHTAVSRFHARIELGEDGLLCLQDERSQNGTFLNRNDSWIRIRKIRLCIGDRIRFGACEITLEDLTAMFGKHANVRLEASRFPPGQGYKTTGVYADVSDHGALLQKPRRNPDTGKIEEDRNE